MASCQFTNCQQMTDGHKFCQCHNFWVRSQGLCYNCLKIKENTDHKLCQTCYMAQQAPCHYPKCTEKTVGQYAYCHCHALWIKSQKLCYKCLQPKEQPKHRLCLKCHQEEASTTVEYTPKKDDK